MSKYTFELFTSLYYSFFTCRYGTELVKDWNSSGHTDGISPGTVLTVCKVVYGNKHKEYRKNC